MAVPGRGIGLGFVEIRGKRVPGGKGRNSVFSEIDRHPPPLPRGKANFQVSHWIIFLPLHPQGDNVEYMQSAQEAETCRPKLGFQRGGQREWRQTEEAAV